MSDISDQEIAEIGRSLLSAREELPKIQSIAKQGKNVMQDLQNAISKDYRLSPTKLPPPPPLLLLLLVHLLEEVP